MAQGMTRVDGSKKSSRGWLGSIKRDDGGVMTEYSIGINIGGKETLVPSLVPTLSKDEMLMREILDIVYDKMATDFVDEEDYESLE